MSHTDGSQPNNLTMKIQTPTAQETSAQPGASPCCDMADGSAFKSVRLIRAYEYMLKRQQELLDAALARNNRLVAAANQLTSQNEKLRNELDGYKRGKFWTLLVAMMPTREMLRDE